MTQKPVTPVPLLAIYKLFFLVGMFSFGGGLSAWFHREIVLVRDAYLVPTDARGGILQIER